VSSIGADLLIHSETLMQWKHHMSHPFLFIEMGLKVHRDGFKPANSLQWWSVVASMRDRSECQLVGLIERKT
jgi:hypothetical protein